MKVIEPSYEILTPIDKKTIYEHIELCGRVCYKSEDRITDESSTKFIKMINGNHHHSVLEHFNLSVRFVHNRGFSHELVRHRIASFSQESTRYCNYSKSKFNQSLTLIKPYEYDTMDTECQVLWFQAMRKIEDTYFMLLQRGRTPQSARGILPNDLKTEIIITANLREWQHIFKLRTSKAAHPDMRRVMIPLQKELHNMLPEIFEVCNENI